MYIFFFSYPYVLTLSKSTTNFTMKRPMIKKLTKLISFPQCTHCFTYQSPTTTNETMPMLHETLRQTENLLNKRRSINRKRRVGKQTETRERGTRRLHLRSPSLGSSIPTVRRNERPEATTHGERKNKQSEKRERGRHQGRGERKTNDK